MFCTDVCPQMCYDWEQNLTTKECEWYNEGSGDFSVRYGSRYDGESDYNWTDSYT
jgi:hypothetical protein